MASFSVNPNAFPGFRPADQRRLPTFGGEYDAPPQQPDQRAAFTSREGERPQGMPGYGPGAQPPGRPMQGQMPPQAMQRYRMGMGMGRQQGPQGPGPGPGPGMGGPEMGGPGGYGGRGYMRPGTPAGEGPGWARSWMPPMAEPGMYGRGPMGVPSLPYRPNANSMMGRGLPPSMMGPPPGANRGQPGMPPPAPFAQPPAPAPAPATPPPSQDYRMGLGRQIRPRTVMPGPSAFDDYRDIDIDAPGPAQFANWGPGY